MRETTALFEEVLKSGTALRIKVTGNSMRPFLKGGETVTIRTVSPQTLRIGDLIFFKNHDGSLILHRLIRRLFKSNRMMFQTKGDALLSFDPPVVDEHILGKVCRIERKTSSPETLDLESLGWKVTNYLVARMHHVKLLGYHGLLMLTDLI